MPRQPDDLLRYIKQLERRIESLERGSSRFGVGYTSEDATQPVFTVNTSPVGISFWGAVPVGQQALAVTLADVIAVLHNYGLTA